MTLSPKLKISSNGLVSITNGLSVAAGGITASGNSVFTGGSVAVNAGPVTLTNITAPSAPGAGKISLYSNNENLYFISGASGTAIALNILSLANTWQQTQTVVALVGSGDWFTSGALKIGNTSAAPKFSVTSAGVVTADAITATGITATSLTVNSGTITAGTFSGNATSASKLFTSRTIAGSPFDGTANITISADNISEGSVNKFLTSEMTTKLNGIAAGATVFTTEMAQDAFGALLAAGTHTNISYAYDDTANSLSLTVSLPSNVASKNDNLSVFASTTSSELAGVISDETGSGKLVFATSPTFETSMDSGTSFGAFASATTLRVGYTGASASTTNISTGAVAASTTKTVNIGTGGVASSTTNVNIGSATGGLVTVNSSLTVTGDLTVNGTTTTINSTTLSIDDKNIELASIASPTDTTADGAGITVKGASDKTLNWVSANTAWTSSENFDLASQKTYKINGTDVLTSSALGSGVTASSLTSVGTLTNLTVTNVISGSINGNAATATTASAAPAGALTGNTLAAGVTASSLTSVGTLTNLTVTNVISGSINGNAATATTASAAPAGALTGNTLAAGVTASSLTSVGTIATGIWNGTAVAIGYGGTGATTAASAITALTGTQTNKYYLRSNGTNATLSALDAADLTGTIPASVLSSTWTTTQTFSNATYSALFTGGNVGIGTSTPSSTLDVKGTLRLSGSTSGYVGFSVAADAGSTTYLLPSTDGTNGQVLSTNASGTLSWITASGSSPAQVTFAESVAAPNAFVPVESMTATNTLFTDIDLALRPKGAGALTAQVADNTTVGGNKRGVRAVDWQMSRNNVALVASGDYSVVSGGRHNSATDVYATVGGGYLNASNAIRSTISGGGYNTVDVNSFNAIIGGGLANSITGGASSVIVGGSSNTASYVFTSILGGSGNTASAQGSTAVGGQGNTVSGYNGFIGGGETNTASGTRSVVAGGYSNQSTGDWASVVGGRDNIASGVYSVIPGGREASAYIHGLMTYASGKFAVTGDAQYELRVLRGVTINETTLVTLTSTGVPVVNDPTDGYVGWTNNMPSVHAMTISIVANSAAVGTSSPLGVLAANWIFDAVSRTATNSQSVLVGEPSLRQLQRDSALATCGISISSGGSYYGVKIEVTGIANTSIHWVAVVTTTKVG